MEESELACHATLPVAGAALEELRRWGEEYAREGRRVAVRSVRFSAAEWGRVCERAEAVSWSPATFVRLIALWEPPSLVASEERLHRLCEGARRLLDLILRGLVADEAGGGAASLSDFRERVAKLRAELEGFHVAFCLPHRSTTYVVPEEVEPVPAEVLWRKVLNPSEANSSEMNPSEAASLVASGAGPGEGGSDAERGRLIVRSVRFRPDEWERVEVRAARAGVEPAVYLRETALGGPTCVAGATHVHALERVLVAEILVVAADLPGAFRFAAEAQDLASRLKELCE